MKKFHDRHGDDVTLSRGGTEATVIGRGVDCEVFSCQPLHPGDSCTVKLEEAKLWILVSIKPVVTCIMPVRISIHSIHAVYHCQGGSDRTIISGEY